MTETIEQSKYRATTIDETTDVYVAKRYSKIQRFQHWGNLILMLTLFITGLEIYLGNYPLLGYELTQDIHVWAGLFVFILSFFIYAIIIVKEKKVKEIIPMPRDFFDIFLIVGCAIGILDDDKYPHYDYYNPEKGKYINKYHPTQKFLATINFVMLFFIAMSGFALYGKVIPDSWGMLVDVGNSVMNPIIDLGLELRFFHFAVFAYFTLSTMIHFYFTMLPQNRQRLKGMATGYQRIPKDRVDH